MTPTHIHTLNFSYPQEKNSHGMLICIIFAILFQVNMIKLVYLYTQLWPPAAQLAGVQEREASSVTGGDIACFKSLFHSS